MRMMLGVQLSPRFIDVNDQFPMLHSLPGDIAASICDNWLGR